MSELNLSTDETRVSYGIGRQLGDQLRDNPPPGVDLSAILAGLTDAFTGQASRVSEAELGASFKVIREIMQAEAAAKAEARCVTVVTERPGTAPLARFAMKRACRSTCARCTMTTPPTSYSRTQTAKALGSSIPMTRTKGSSSRREIGEGQYGCASATTKRSLIVSKTPWCGRVDQSAMVRNQFVPFLRRSISQTRDQGHSIGQYLGVWRCPEPDASKACARVG